MFKELTGIGLTGSLLSKPGPNPLNKLSFLYLKSTRTPKISPKIPSSSSSSDRIQINSMECVFGLVGDGFALIVADTSAVNSILVHKSNEDKVMILDSHKLLGASGEAGDRVQFTEFIQKNVLLYQFRNGIPLTTAATANFTRNELATALRKNPYSVNILLAGYDKDVGPSLYYIDYIATLHKIDKGAFGYASYFCLALMDRYYHSGMLLDEAVELADKCILEIRSRLVAAPPNFVIKVVDKDGAKEHAWRESIKDTAAA